MRWSASRAGVPHLAPGALNTAGSALCAFLSTVVAKARGAQHPLLREASEAASRVDRLVTLVHTSCAAPLSSDESDSESDESESDSDSDTPDIRYAWEHTLRTRWSDTPGHDGLTEKVVRDALEGLDYKVYGGNPFLSDLARAYHERFGRDVLGLLRDGILNVERFLGELKDDADDEVFGLRLTRSMDLQPRESGSRDARTTNIPTPYCGAVGCLCPCCGRECLLWLVKYLSSPNAPTSVQKLEPVVDMDRLVDMYLLPSDMGNQLLDGDEDGITPLQGDCDDNDPLAFPGNMTPSSGRDYDCDGLVDDGLAVETYYADTDGDGFGNEASGPPS